MGRNSSDVEEDKVLFALNDRGGDVLYFWKLNILKLILNFV